MFRKKIPYFIFILIAFAMLFTSCVSNLQNQNNPQAFSKVDFRFFKTGILLSWQVNRNLVPSNSYLNYNLQVQNTNGKVLYHADFPKGIYSDLIPLDLSNKKASFWLRLTIRGINAAYSTYYFIGSINNYAFYHYLDITDKNLIFAKPNFSQDDFSYFHVNDKITLPTYIANTKANFDDIKALFVMINHNANETENYQGIPFSGQTSKVKTIIDNSDKAVLSYADPSKAYANYLSELSHSNQPRFLANKKNYAVSQAVIFKDSHLEAALRKMFKLPQNQTIYANTFSSVKVLKLSHSHISSLSDLKNLNLSHLEYLDLSYNNLTSLSGDDFNFLPNLKFLSLSHNSLTAISSQTFYPLTSLKGLYLNYNQLTTLPETLFSQNPNLFGLDLSHNYLNTLSPHFLFPISQLLRLNLSYNKINQLDAQTFSHSAALKFLFLLGNPINNLPASIFIPLKSLDTLYIPKNLLNTTSIRDLINIKKDLPYAFNIRYG